MQAGPLIRDAVVGQHVVVKHVGGVETVPQYTFCGTNNDMRIVIQPGVMCGRVMLTWPGCTSLFGASGG